MNEKVIPVFMNADDQYTVPTYIAIYSMLYNHKSSEILHFSECVASISH